MIPLAIMQAAPLDPNSYASFGVFGALVFVIVVLAGIIYAVFVKGAAESRARTDAFMQFAKDHTAHHVEALGNLGNKIQAGDERLAQAFEANARLTRSVLVTWEALARARALKAGGGALTASEVDAIIRTAHDTVTRNSG